MTLRPFRFPPCRACHGSGSVYVTLIPGCDGPPSVCGHFQHYAARRCWWCRGSRRADILTAIIAYVWSVIGDVLGGAVRG